MKRCTRCGEGKGWEQFYRDKNRNDGLRSECKACHNAKKKARHAKKKAQAARLVAKRESHAAWQRQRRSADPIYALCQRAGSDARGALKGKNPRGFFRYLPYTRKEFAAHLISTLPPDVDPADLCDGSKWHIDHIRPVSSFDFTDGYAGEDWQRCWSLANLRMLPAAKNLVKSDSLSGRPAPGECPTQDWIWEGAPNA